ncbi:Wzz/FepE/Etk N-terminal domain-containing protein [Catenovulum sediminis]|uniref:Wzz/FepE/Etk N-terminal domain-containing protein n=1 Tax=Catenovulum sediminis TaxID=1740262 RepID=A0ABV1RJV9_9ALTE
MNELENRLARIEEKLSQKLDSDFTDNRDDEIDLRELWNVIWAGRIKIIAITAVFAIASVIYALSLPNMYKSEIILAPAQSDGKSSMGALSAQYGGLAAMAGINLGGGDSSRVEQAVELIKSWPFLEELTNRYRLKPKLMAVKKWNYNTNELIYNTDVYDSNGESWLVQGGEEPSSWETYKTFEKMLRVNYDVKKGMLSISVTHYSPYVAHELVNLLAFELNKYFQSQDMLKARKNIRYLEEKIIETNLTDMQSVFYNMIESQIQTLMLAEVSEEYLVETVVPASVPEVKSKPSRALLVILFSLIGFTIALLTTCLFRKTKI